jgi:hypothetical protein
LNGEEGKATPGILLSETANVFEELIQKKTKKLMRKKNKKEINTLL